LYFKNLQNLRFNFLIAEGDLAPIPLKLFAKFLDYFGRVLPPICGGLYTSSSSNLPKSAETC